MRIEVGVGGDAGVEHGDDGRRVARRRAPRRLKAGHAAQTIRQRVGVAAADAEQPPLTGRGRRGGKQRVAGRDQAALALISHHPLDLGMRTQLRGERGRLVAAEYAAEIEAMCRPAKRTQVRCGDAGGAEHASQTFVFERGERGVVRRRVLELNN